MLPSIDAQQWLVLPNHGILILFSSRIKSVKWSSNWLDRRDWKSTDRVCSNANLPRLGILHQPGPAAALDARQLGIHQLLQVLQPAEGGIDGFPKLAARRLPAAFALGRQVLPEQAVVDVAAAVEVDDGLQSNLVGDGFGGVELLRRGELLGRGVEGVDVGVVVLGVVELHDLAGYGRLEGGVVIWKRGGEKVSCVSLVGGLRGYGEVAYMVGREG